MYQHKTELFKNNSIYGNCITQMSDNIMQKAGRDLINVLSESVPELIIQIIYKNVVLDKISGEEISNESQIINSYIDVFTFSIVISIITIILNIKVAILDGGFS